MFTKVQKMATQVLTLVFLNPPLISCENCCVALISHILGEYNHLIVSNSCSAYVRDKKVLSITVRLQNKKILITVSKTISLITYFNEIHLVTAWIVY